MENYIESRKNHIVKPSNGHVVSVKGKNIFYVENGSGPVILYIHGNLGSHLWFSDVMNIEGFKTIALDMPNFGFSDSIDSAEIDVYTNYIGAFIDKLDLKNVIVTGHSLGGVVAQSLAVKRPELISSLILIDSGSIKGLKTPEESYAIFEQYKVDYELLKKALCYIMPEQKSEKRITELVDMALMMSHHAYAGHARTLERFDISDIVRKGIFPVLVVRGEKDILITREMAEETAEAWGGQLLFLKNSGHSPQVEDPVEFRNILWEFLKNDKKG